MSAISSLYAQYGVTEEDMDKEISDLHMDKIVRTRCTHWKSLPPYLGLPTNLVKDIDKDFSKEVDKRREFFDQWKQQKGSEATYKNLVRALLDVKEVYDAKYVCKLSHEQSSTIPLGMQ